MAKKRFSREQIIHLLLRDRTLPEILNPPPSTLHPPRYQTEKGVVELLATSVCQISSVHNSFLPLLASRLHLRLTFKGGLNTGGWTNIRKTTLERMKKRLEQKNRERSQKYRDEIKSLKKEIKSLNSKRTTKSNSEGSDIIKEAKSILRKIKFYGRGELNMERVGDLRELFGLHRYG